MASPFLLLERARRENQILADMAALVQAGGEYPDVTESLLDLLEQVVSSPMLSLAINDDDGLRHHARLHPDTDPAWGEQVSVALETYLYESFPRLLRVTPLHTEIGSAHCALFPAETLTGHGCILTLATDAPLSLDPDEERLMLRVARQIILVIEHALLQRRIERMETTDALTGLPNYRRLLDILQYEMQRHRHSGRKLSILLLDVEGLRAINRSYGNSYGDHILIKLAGLIRDALRPIDMVARCGLDDFAVVLPETEDDDAARIAEDLRERVEEVRFAGGAIALSTGLTQFNGEEHLSAEHLLSRAESALYDAKRHERGWRALSHRRATLRRP